MIKTIKVVENKASSDIGNNNNGISHKNS